VTVYFVLQNVMIKILNFILEHKIILMPSTSINLLAQISISGYQ